MFNTSWNIFSLILGILLFSGCQTSATPGTEPEDPPTPADVFSSGKGTEADPYRIASAADLLTLSRKTNEEGSAEKYAAAFYRQTADIDLEGMDFTPLCQGTIPFSGHYDGTSHKISHLRIHTPSVRKPTAFIANATHASLKDIVFESADIDAGYVYSATVVGHAEQTTVSGVSVSGRFRQFTAGLTVVKDVNEGFSGAIAGWADHSTFENCVMDGSVTIYGTGSGGLFGVVENSTVTGCRFLKDNAVNINGPGNGGLIGVVRGASSFVRDCSFEGNLTSQGYAQGGIVGRMEGGRIERCIVGSYANVGSEKYHVGGISGMVIPIDEVVIDRCAVYGNLNGRFAIGGIVGYCGFGDPASLKVDSATRPVVLSNCAFIGGEITATGNNGESARFSIAGGIVGWSSGTNALTIQGCYSRPRLVQTVSPDNRGALAGILASQNNSSGSVIVRDCYSTVTPTGMLNRNEQVTALDGYPCYGGIYCRIMAPTTFADCFCDDAIQMGPDDLAAQENTCEALPTAQFTDGTLLGKLQAAANGTVWQAGTDGLPAIKDLPADPNVKPKGAKRVSVIGDSISTFKGWMPYGYSGHYPTADGKLTLVSETYWYRLIYDYMENAMLDMNISFSASTVTNTTTEIYRAKYGSDIQTWWHKDFVSRFRENGGCGQPDIILIFGGTNDYARNIDPLAPGIPIRNDASNDFGGRKPSADILNAIYSTADAARMRGDIEALPDGSFCEAYAKLLCLIRERYPQCKVVCIIGDYINSAVEESILDIAGHYGAKTVNLFRVNGFNDLGGYSPSTLTNVGTQPNMPKHDYSGNITGGHPAPEGMAFIAKKIYTELGSWLEQ